MNTENTKKLFDTFKFFHPEKSPKKSLMCFGFECGDGWYDILFKLCKSIKKELEAIREHDEESKSFIERRPFEVLQVKEKFGGLRFYANWTSNDIDKLIEKAEEESLRTCEWCGKQGELIGENWVITLCNSCDNGRAEK